MKYFILLDIETTGLHPEFCEITEIGAIKVEFSSLKIVDEFQSLIITKKDIPNWITSLTGITNKMIKNNGKKLNVVLKDLVHFSHDLPIYAHFAQFDKKFIRKNLKELKINYIETEWIDTIKIFRKLIPGFKRYALNFLINSIGVKYSERHRAIEDAKTTLEILRIAKGKKYIPWWSWESKLKTTLFRVKKQILESNDINKFLCKKALKLPITYILNSLGVLSDDYKSSINRENEIPYIEDKDYHKQAFESNQILGTSFDQMIEYYYDKTKYFKRLQNDNKIDKFIIRQIFNKRLNNRDFLLMSFSIMKYRSGNLLYEKDINEIFENRLNNYTDILKSFKEAMKLAKVQVKKIKNSKVIFNPIFGSNLSGIKADGDLIIDECLCEIKLSNSINFEKSYMHQLISYILLNEYLEIKYKINKNYVIYWNPMFNYFKRVKIIINRDIKNEFKKMLLVYEKIILNKDWKKLLDFYISSNNDNIDKEFIDLHFRKYFKISNTPRIIKNKSKEIKEFQNPRKYFCGKSVAIIGKTIQKRSLIEKKVIKMGGQIMKNVGITTNIVIYGKKWNIFERRLKLWFTEKISESEFNKI